jgi:hypothetical protein
VGSPAHLLTSSKNNVVISQNNDKDNLSSAKRIVNLKDVKVEMEEASGRVETAGDLNQKKERKVQFGTKPAFTNRLKNKNSKTKQFRMMKNFTGQDLEKYGYKPKDFFKNNMTYRDIIALNTELLLEHDDRSYLIYLWDLVKTKHSLISLFIPSILKSNSVNFILLCIGISLNFGLNAFFYNDEFIEQRNFAAGSENTTSFSYTVQHELSKSIFSFIIGAIPMMVIRFIAKPSLKSQRIVNEYVMSRNKPYIKQGARKYCISMLPRNTIALGLGIILHLICWYYVTAFCAVYVNSSQNWIYGGVLSLIIDWCIVQPCKFLIHLFIRFFAKWNRESK